MKLIARKPCSFGGKKFYIGEEIPAEYVLEPKNQEKMGTIAIVNDDAVAPAPAEERNIANLEQMTVVIHDKNGDIHLNLTAENIQSVVDVLTGPAPKAEPIIAEMTNVDALILLHAAEQRKSVKTAAEDRAQALSETQESAGDQ